ncbi:TDT family transporter [uncultured Brachyspira sp.]|uniref:TDT family transporter n=1 Tax=uncultured Brachyspira sp. TaxID=221953 RepID=UPI0026157DB4|nr:TDT family transporter [uncultured Brachyspira sp.]
MIRKINKMPLALTGLALGVGGIFNAWTIFTGIKYFAYVGALISSILILTIITKIFSSFGDFLNDLEHPVAGSTIPTLDMAVMVISSSVVKFVKPLGVAMWFTAIAVHIIFAFTFLAHRINLKDLHHILPSWFVPPVGIVVAAVTGSNMGFPQVSQVIVYIGTVLYIILFPFIFYRIIFHDPLADDRFPAFAVMGAPANLCLCGYLTAFTDYNTALLNLLLALGLFTTFKVYLSLIRAFQIKFIPLFAAYTFPLAVGAQALLKYANYSKSVNGQYFYIWNIISIFELIVASMMIIYVFVNMMFFVHNNVIKDNK